MGCPNGKMTRISTPARTERANELIAAWMREDGHRCVNVRGAKDTDLDWCMRKVCTGTRNAHAPRGETQQQRKTRAAGEFERGNAIKVDTVRRRGHECVGYVDRTPLEMTWCAERRCAVGARHSNA